MEFPTKTKRTWAQDTAGDLLNVLWFEMAKLPEEKQEGAWLLVIQHLAQLHEAMAALVRGKPIKPGT